MIMNDTIAKGKSCMMCDFSSSTIIRFRALDAIYAKRLEASGASIPVASLVTTGALCVGLLKH